MSAPTAELVQSAALSGVVALWDLDLSPIIAGLPVLHFASTHTGADAVLRGGVRYWPVPMEDRGFARGGLGAPPQPELNVGDAHGILRGWVWSSQDLVGAEATRTLVLRDHLDDGAHPDSAEYLLRDVFRLEQKIGQVPSAISWRLVARWDQTARYIPGRQVVRDTCRLRYRVRSGGAWDYSKATCPYVGTDLFTVHDATTAVEAEDQCSRRLRGCRLRFPTGALPITAFPGVGRH